MYMSVSKNLKCINQITQILNFDALQTFVQYVPWTCFPSVIFPNYAACVFFVVTFLFYEFCRNRSLGEPIVAQPKYVYFLFRFS